MGHLCCKASSSVPDVESRKKEMAAGLLVFRFKDLEAATGGFAVDALLGKGSHCCVYKGVLGNGMQVAVKRPSSGRRVLHDQAAFDNEIQILSKLNNPRLVKLVGFCVDSKEKLLVVEFMQKGTLYDILHDGPEPLSWYKRVHLALQTARAVLDLHEISPPIVHRDIKSTNILIDRRWNAKLGDFGLALWRHPQVSMPPAGTLGYLDPEYTTPEMLSTKNDVFSFGILLLEILSGRNAIDMDCTPPSILDWAVPLIKGGKAQAVFDPRLQPPKSTRALKQMVALAARCASSKSSRRPAMSDVVQQLEDISRRICFPIFDVIARKIRRNVAVSEKILVSSEKCQASLLLHAESSMKGCSRSPTVYNKCPVFLHISPRDANIDIDSYVQKSEPSASVDFHGCHPFVMQTPSYGDEVSGHHVTNLQTKTRSLTDWLKEAKQVMSITVSVQPPKQMPI